jgi:SAM-dependent methyltransferase
MNNNNFFIKSNYVINSKEIYYNDTDEEDRYQKEVYEAAKELFDNNNFESVLDIGCGSGYKLVKYFSNVKTLGLDVERTVNFLQEKYPTKNWSSNFNPVNGYDLIISSDVIEHIANPDILINLIKDCKPKLIILSTPDRNLLPVEVNNGPPKNLSHIREWSFEEFYQYIGYHFDIIDHYISNKKQATQVIVAKLKNETST